MCICENYLLFLFYLLYLYTWYCRCRWWRSWCPPPTGSSAWTASTSAARAPSSSPSSPRWELRILELSTGLRKFHEVTLTSLALVNMMSRPRGLKVRCPATVWLCAVINGYGYIGCPSHSTRTCHSANIVFDDHIIISFIRTMPLRFSLIPIHTFSLPALHVCNWRYIAHWTGRAGWMLGWGGWAGEGEPVPMCHPRTWSCTTCTHWPRVTLQCCSAAVLQCPALQLLTRAIFKDAIIFAESQQCR